MREELQQTVGVAQDIGLVVKEDAAIQAGNPVGQPMDGIKIVLDPDHGCTVGTPVFQQALKDHQAIGIKRRHRLIKQQEIGHRQQALRQQHTLSLTTGEVAHAPPGPTFHADLRQYGLHLRRRTGLQPPEQRAFLAHGGEEIANGHRQAAVAFERLRNVAHRTWPTSRPVQTDFPTVGHQTEDAFQKTAFAATIRANQGMNLPWRNLPVERFKNLRTAQLQCRKGVAV